MRALAAIAFFLSGASSLIFQTLWTRMLHHTFGATSVALSTVLTAFMMGLGLGAFLFGRRAARIARPLAVYALAEIGVALCALVIPWMVRTDGPLALLNALLRAQLGEASLSFMLARFACVLPLLLVPTTLMGGSLPLLAQQVARWEGASRGGQARVGMLYAVNTLGAVAGTLLGSFVLMPAVGVRATNHVAVAINLALGLGILLLARPARAGNVRQPAQPGEPTRVPGRYLALLSFGISGACAMTYEVVWSRALAMAIGSSLQSFALILVTFLVGIAGGSAVVARLLGGREDAGLWLLSALSAALSLVALAPAIVLSSSVVGGTLFASICAALWLHARTVDAHAGGLARAGEELAEEARARRERAGLHVLLLPALVASVEVLRFSSQRSGRLGAVALHGYLPYISATSVVACVVVLGLMSALRRSPWLLASGMQLAIAVGTCASYAVQDEIPYAFARLVSALSTLPDHVGLVRFFMLLAAGFCTLPAALGMGAMFPIALAQWSERRDQLAADVGRVYAANTLGSIVGAWLPGFVLLPRWGMERTLLAGMALNAALALVLACARPTRLAGRRPARALAMGAATCIIAIAAQQALPSAPLRWDLAHMTLGAFRVSLADDVLDTKQWGTPELLYYRDGVSTTVSVERWGGEHLSLKNNGKVDASNDHDMPTQVMVAAVPLLLHPRAEAPLDVAIVGFGSGVTVGAARSFAPRRLDVVELEDAVVDAASRHFAEVNHLTRTRDEFPYVSAPGLMLHHDDGRNFLAASARKWDVIISEPSNPWITGVSDLFTVEHFSITKRRLADGGLYCQWVQLYELSPENIKTVYRTFASQFRHVLAFSAEAQSSDTILIGSDAPLSLDLPRVTRMLARGEVATELARAGVHVPSDVFARLLFASRAEIMQFTHTELRNGVEVQRATGRGACPTASCRRVPVPLNTDDNMRIELSAPADLIGFARYRGYLDLFYADSWPYGALPSVVRGADDEVAQLELALSLLAHGRPRAARAYADVLRTTANAELLRDLRSVQLLLGEAAAPPLPRLSATLRVPATRSGHRNLQQLRDRAESAFARGEHARAVTLLESLPMSLRTLSGSALHFAYGVALYASANGDSSQLARAASQLEKLMRRDPIYVAAHPEVQYFLARTEAALQRPAQALRTMRTYTASEAAALVPQAPR